MRRCRIWALAVVAWGACSGGDGGSDDGPVRLRGRCDPAERAGGFRIIAGERASFVAGAVADAVSPTGARTDVAAAGGCAVSRRDNRFCDPPCGAGEICGDGDACVALPDNLDLGDLRVTGLAGGLALTLSPLAPGDDYVATDVPHPVIDDGAELRLRGESLSLDGRGSPPLTGVTEVWALAAGAPLVLGWDPPPVDRSTTIVVRLAINQHGTTPAALTCELADTGVAEIGPAIVDALIDAGVSGFPDATVTRATYDRVEAGGGCVDLEVGHVAGAAASIAGHTPCDAPDQCPDGQTCDLEVQTCVAL